MFYHDNTSTKMCCLFIYIRMLLPNRRTNMRTYIQTDVGKFRFTHKTFYADYITALENTILKESDNLKGISQFIGRRKTAFKAAITFNLCDREPRK